MTIGIQVTDNIDEVLTDIEGKLPDRMERALLEASEFVVGEIRREIFDKFPTGKGGLARSYKAQILKVGDQIVAGALSDSVYAGIQDRGGTINARGKKLAVPVGAGRTLPVGTGPRDVPGLVLIPRPNGDALLAKTRKDGSLDVYFVLKDSVRLRGRDYLQPAADRSETTVTEILSNGIQDMIDDADERL